MGQGTRSLSSAQLGARAREPRLLFLSMSSPPWLPRQPKRQTTGTRGRPRPKVGREQLSDRRERQIRPPWQPKVEIEPRRARGPSSTSEALVRRRLPLSGSTLVSEVSVVTLRLDFE